MKTKTGILIFIGLLQYSCSSKQESLKPEIGTITESVYASAVVKSLNQYTVYPSASGILSEVLVKEGDEVKNQDVMFKLVNDAAGMNRDNAALASEYSNYEANRIKLNEIKLNIDFAAQKAKQDSLIWVRQKNLWTQNIGSKLELEQKELAYKNSLTNLESLRIRYKDLDRQLKFVSAQSKKNFEISSRLNSDFVIKSELDGKVYSILRKKGEMVSQQTPVAIIGDAQHFYLELQVDENDISLINSGMKVFVTLESYRDSLFEARIKRIYPIMNERSRTFTVEAEFTRSPSRLFPNLSAEASIVIRSREKTLSIPREYLVNDSFVLLSSGKKIAVKTGLKDYNRVEILSGINSDDELIKPESE